MAAEHEKSWFDRMGCKVSGWVSDLAAEPLAQIAVIVICALWFLLGFKPDILTAILSIMAITLTQMVLNRQNEREADDHRRDVAMHAKLDELLLAMKGARDEMAGIEDLDEAEIAQLKEDVKESIERDVDADSKKDVANRAAEAVEQAAKSKKAPVRATAKAKRA